METNREKGKNILASAGTAPGLLGIEGNNGIFIGRAALDIKYFTAMINFL